MKALSALALALPLTITLLTSPPRNKAVSAQERLDLSTSITMRNSGLHGLPVKAQLPSQFNMIGLSGYVAISSEEATDKLYLALISIQNSPSGKCPTEPILFDSDDPHGEKRELYPDSHSVSNFIVKNIGSGRKEVPVEFTLPVKVPLTGCFFIDVDGITPEEGRAMTVESHLFMIYDTQPAPSPAPYFLRSSFEFCYGIEGCRASTKEPTAENAFARVFKIDTPLYLWSFSGDVSASTFVPPWHREPQGPWTMNFDYYLYKDCPPPPIGFSGPEDYYSQIPESAENLLSLKFQGDGRGAFHQPVFKELGPKLVEPGNCLVGLTRTVGDGAFSDESQVYTLVQPATRESCEIYDPGGQPLDWSAECTSEDQLYCTQTSCVPPTAPYSCVSADNTPFRIGNTGNDQFVYCGKSGAWRDADYRAERCADVSILSGWSSGCSGESCFVQSGEVSPHGDYSTSDIGSGATECCGDDANERYLCNDSLCRCCNTEHDYLDADGSCRTKGDLDGDSQVTPHDLKLLLKNWGESATIPQADLNGDKVVNGIDFGAAVKLTR